MEFRTYIVPFDFSENAMVAAKLAAEIVKANSGDVVLAHGTQLPNLPSPNPAISGEELGESVRAHVEKRLAEVHAQLGVGGSCVVRTEPPENWLNDFARTLSAPLIVLGRHGWSGKQEGLGSTAKKIIRASSVSIWVVGQPAELPKKIMAAVETDPVGERCAEAAQRIAAQVSGECRFVHVRDPRVETGYLSEIGWPPAVNVFDDLRREAENFLRGLVEKYAAPKPSAAVLSGSPAPTVVQEAKQWGADLLVVGKHHKGAIERVFLGSTTEAVLKSWPCHTLVLAAP